MNFKVTGLLACGLAVLAACGGDKNEVSSDNNTILAVRTFEDNNGEGNGVTQVAFLSGNYDTPEEAQAAADEAEWQDIDDIPLDDEFDFETVNNNESEALYMSEASELMTMQSRPPGNGGGNRPPNWNGNRPPNHGGGNRPPNWNGNRPPNHGGGNRPPNWNGNRPPNHGGGNRPGHNDRWDSGYHGGNRYYGGGRHGNGYRPRFGPPRYGNVWRPYYGGRYWGNGWSTPRRNFYGYNYCSYKYVYWYNDCWRPVTRAYGGYAWSHRWGYTTTVRVSSSSYYSGSYCRVRFYF